MTELYALVGEILTTTGPTRAAVVIREGEIVDLLRDPQYGELPEEHREFAPVSSWTASMSTRRRFVSPIGPRAPRV
jgi:hypothetical protein